MMEVSNDFDCTLPNELWLKIFETLTNKDLQNVKLVCKHWRYLIQASNLNNRFTLFITHRTWSTMRPTLRSNKEFSKTMNYKNVHINTVSLTQRDLRVLKYLRCNVQNLVVRNCMLNTNWNGSSLFRNLKTLNIDYLTLNHQQCLRLASGNLKELRLEILAQPSAMYGVALIKRVSRTIINLDMTNYRSDVSLASLKDCFQSITNLQMLKIKGLGFYEGHKVILQSLSKENHLKYVSLRVPVTGDLLEIVLAKWSNTVQEIYLSDAANIISSAYNHFKLVKNNLVHLELTSCKGLTKESLLEGLISTPNTVLRTLILNSSSNIDEDILCILCQGLPNLTYLSLLHCEVAITDKSLAYISDYLVQLQSLFLDLFINCSVDVIDMSFNKLRRPTLRILHVANRRITNNDAAELVKNCPALQSLNICCCPEINDDAIYIIAKNLKQLRFLDISCCKDITERSIDYIIMYSEQLRELLLYGKWTVNNFNVGMVKMKLSILRPDVEVYIN